MTTQGHRIVDEHLARLAPLQLRGAHLHGSLALGGYRHGISDQDLVVLLDHPLTADERALVDASHREAGPLLAAAYVHDPTDPEAAHPTWTHGWSGERRVSLITRAELHQAHPADWPAVPDLPAAVVAEVTRAWSRELRAPRTWLRTEYVDLSLTSLARAHLTVETGRLVGKEEALAQLERLGVEARLAEAVRARREGREALRHNRFTRAVTTRRRVKRLLAAL